MKAACQGTGDATSCHVLSRALGPVVLACLGLLAGCAPHALAVPFVARAASDASGHFGWFLAAGDGTAVRLEGLGEHPACDRLQPPGEGGRTVYVIVHGLGGDGPETQAAVRTLLGARTAHVFVFRWFPWGERHVLVDRLARGLSRLAECGDAGPGRIVVVAHSAGGVLASLAAARVTPPAAAPDGWLTVLTVAAPLSGAVRGPASDDHDDLMFLFDLGAEPHYAAAARGVSVVHLRTQAPADDEMEPRFGHAPNRRLAGVPGARRVDLPPGLSHSDALLFVARRLAADTLFGWVAAQR